MSVFDMETRQRCKELTGVDPDNSYRELMLDVRVGGPAAHRIRTWLDLLDTLTADETTQIVAAQQRRHGHAAYLSKTNPCRCDTCRAASATYARNNRKKRAAA